MKIKNYGKAFKNIRQQKGISLNQLEKKSGVPKSTLSQFENEKSLLSYDKLDKVLETMDVTLYDYSLLTRDGAPETFISKFHDILVAIFNQDKKKLLSIYALNINSDSNESYLIGLCAKANYSNLVSHEKIKIEQRLNFLPVWGVFELNILLFTVEQFHLGTLDRLVEEVISHQTNKEYITLVRDYRELLIQIILKIIYSYIKMKEQEKAEYLLQYMAKFLTDLDVSFKIMHHILGGCFIYIFEEEVNGNKKINEGIDMLETIGSYQLKKIIEEKINILKQQE